jgi:hypothetical protein
MHKRWTSTQRSWVWRLAKLSVAYVFFSANQLFLSLFTRFTLVVLLSRDAFCREQTAHKQYLAVAIGKVAQDSFQVDGPVERHPTVK